MARQVLGNITLQLYLVLSIFKDDATLDHSVFEAMGKVTTKYILYRSAKN